MSKNTLLVSFILGAIGVLIGAFGAHALKAILLENSMTETFKTGVFYHLIHTLALFGTGILMLHNHSKSLRYASIFFVLGILFFSFSLYLLSITNIKLIGVITPLGGLFFIAGWIFLLISVKNS